MRFSPHVLMLAPSRSLHTRRWACDLAINYHITLMTADPDESPEFAAAYAAAGVQLERLPYRTKSAFLRSAGHVYRRVMAAEADGRPVHFIHAFYTTDYGLLAVLSGAAPVLLSVMGTDVFSYPNRSRLHRFGTTWILKQAACVAATSRVMARRVEALTNASVKPRLTPFGVDTKVFRPKIPSSEKHDLQKFRIISVRHLHHKYGLDILIEALRLLLNQHPEAEIELHIGGDGPEEGRLHRQIRQGGLEHRVKLLGRIPPEQLPQVLSQYDVFVAPSREESFGVAILEASACGLPVVGSEVGGIPEVITQGKTGILFPSEDIHALMKVLLSLYNNPEQRSEMGAAGAAFVQTTYSREHALKHMQIVYEHMSKHIK